ncbi:hypothetical protein HDV00_002799 [Rhizophlyctis rosea]|nr:hypothetical protein HDV00_002799 [Rhizophlyctis rosea]
MTHIELEQSSDRVLPASAQFVGTRASAAPNIELLTEPNPTSANHRPLIDVEEPRIKYDTESDGEFEAFANKTKIAPKREPSEPDLDADAQLERARSPSPRRSHSPAASVRSMAQEAQEDARPATPRSVPPVNTGESFGAYLRGGDSGLFGDSEDGIRRQKSYLLHQYELKNKDGRYSSKVLTMDCDLREIKDELQFVETRRDMEGSLGLWRTGLVVLADGLVEVNNWVNPMNIDMREWSQRINFEVMNKGSYDEVLLELIEKYRSSVAVGPELHLLMMMGMSFGSTMVTKRIEKTKLEQLDKLRKAQEKQMDDVIEARVREHLARAGRAPSPAPPAQRNRTSPSHGGHSVPSRKGPLPTRAPSPIDLQGPTLTADEIRNLMRDDFLDSSVDEARPPSPGSGSPRAESPRPVSPPPRIQEDDVRSVCSIPDDVVTPAIAKKAPKRAAAGGRRKRKTNELIINLDRD